MMASSYTYYRIDLDRRIFMPAFASFEDIPTYAHEAAHATGAKHRLDRDFGAQFSHEARAVEELVVELTAGNVRPGRPRTPTITRAPSRRETGWRQISP